jgi:hypothetical protein
MLPGTIHNVYVEDNLFLYDSAYPKPSPGPYGAGGDAAIYGNPGGGSAVIRYNTFTGYNATYLDAHGDVNGQDCEKLYEIYKNSFIHDNYGAGGSYSPVGDQRGGSWIVWGNTVGGTFANGVELLNYYGTNGHPVKNTFVWDNNFGAYTASPGIVTMPEPVLNRDYFLHAPQPGQAFYPYAPYVYPHPLVQ